MRNRRFLSPFQIDSVVDMTEFVEILGARLYFTPKRRFEIKRTNAGLI